jgi:G6PDH family F420-dependent oxidoreductase
MRLVEQARMAEEAGFNFVSISDHFHPWIPAQGNSSFVWSVIGGIAATTTRLRVGTGVTCPTMRIHPAIIAQAAATASEMLQGRFYLGVGTGEALNEHITGQAWPISSVRLAMLTEAIEIMRDLWTGKPVNFSGEYYDVVEATLYTKPSSPIPIYVASASPASARLAAENDGIVSTGPNEKMFRAFNEAGGQSKPRYGQITICWDEDRAKAEERAHRIWPVAAMGWDAKSDVAAPTIFEDFAKYIPVEEVTKKIICGPDPEPIVRQVKKLRDAGFDHIYFHQVGENIGPFMRFFERELAPALSGNRELAGAGSRNGR